MAVYTTAKCGHCGINWTTLNPNTPNTVFGKLGPPVIKCSTCYRDNKTNYKLIRDLNPLEKILYVKVKNIFGIILSLCFIAVGFYLGFVVTPGAKDEGIVPAVILFSVFSVAFVVLGVIGIKNNVNGSSDFDCLEMKYDSNGGFLWSNEYY